MNHDPASTSPADPDPNSNRREDDADDDNSNAASSQQQNGTATGRRPKLSKKTKAGLNKKLLFVLHLLMSLDAVIYAELCVLYYMDVSFFRLLIRWIPHWLFLSVKPDIAIIPYFNYPIGAIIGPNIFCMILHLATSLPQASEISRGYLHGGVLVDFVGQKAPTSKFTLLLLDVLVLTLQCFMLSVNLEKDRIKKILNPPRQPVGGTGATPAPANASQDHDHEERGVLRDGPTTDETDDIEMQPLRGSNDAGNVGHASLAERRSSSGGNLRDVLSSGNAILADFHVRDALRRAYTDRGNTSEAAAAYTLQSVGYNTTLAALAAQRRARFAAAQTGTVRRP
ncbi:hypothetical protein BKA67DRAFT_541381 [Truncatella angustata]|uniref:DUF1746 domain-containing protein n=1 Tax=Truncatella angustata TaxID=152316 RepID=A0A9P8U9K8_9PEZI|nr:uncharacterized protein BKA67DRAFT_541381 [Truncatella angustata]KAH6646414.1 hypothetical protein BKA67DRAFT_541381 [Truncatella angustata]KAH8200739.1 hypothetical protein TruAng_005128 [Truncatella angustata]